MFDPNPPPAGSTIVRFDCPSGLTLHWRPSQLHPARKLMITFAVMWVVMVCIFAVVILAGGLGPEFEDPPNPAPFEEPTLFVFLGIQVLLGVLLVGVPAVWPRQPERLTLTDASLEWDSGSATIPLAFLAGGLFHFTGTTGSEHPPFIWRRQRLTVPREEVQRLSLERVGERQRLTFDHGADRIEIGPALREPEREWLAQVLRAWQGEEQRRSMGC